MSSPAKARIAATSVPQREGDELGRAVVVAAEQPRASVAGRAAVLGEAGLADVVGVRSASGAHGAAPDAGDHAGRLRPRKATLLEDRERQARLVARRDVEQRDADVALGGHVDDARQAADAGAGAGQAKATLTMSPGSTSSGPRTSRPPALMLSVLVCLTQPTPSTSIGASSSARTCSRRSSSCGVPGVGELDEHTAGLGVAGEHPQAAEQAHDAGGVAGVQLGGEAGGAAQRERRGGHPQLQAAGQRRRGRGASTRRSLSSRWTSAPNAGRKSSSGLIDGVGAVPPDHDGRGIRRPQRRLKRNWTSALTAQKPSRHVIFLPSAYVRP